MPAYQVGSPSKIAAARKRGELQENVSGGKMWIYIVAGFTMLQSVLAFAQSSDYTGDTARFIQIFAAGYAVLSVIYFFLGKWATTAKVAAPAIALLLYIGVQVLFFLLEPSLVMRGFIWKGAVIAALLKAIVSAKSLEKK